MLEGVAGSARATSSKTLLFLWSELLNASPPESSQVAKLVKLRRVAPVHDSEIDLNTHFEWEKFVNKLHFAHPMVASQYRQNPLLPL